MEGASNVSWFEPLTAVADYFTSLPLHPVFNTVHFILTAFALRNEPGGVQFAQRHPIASCVMTFLVASSGGLLANISLGRPLVECLLNARVLATCVAAWYLVFFSPLDIFYGLCHFVPFNLSLCVLKELSRAKKVFAGVKMAASLYPNSILAMALVGMFKGSGKQWGITWYHLVFNPQSACKHELLSISLATKTALTLGLLLACNHAYPIFDPSLLVMLGGCGLVAIKLWNTLIRNVDPFLPLQTYTWDRLTSLSVTHPHREVVATERGRGQDGTPEKGHGHSEIGMKEPGKAEIVESIGQGEKNVSDDSHPKIPESIRRRRKESSNGCSEESPESMQNREEGGPGSPEGKDCLEEETTRDSVVDQHLKRE